MKPDNLSFPDVPPEPSVPPEKQGHTAFPGELAVSKSGRFEGKRTDRK